MSRVNPIKDEEAYRKYFEDHPYCQVCGMKHLLSRHHIIKFGRSDEACNLLVLCIRCHNLAEGLLVRDPITQELFPKLTIGICLSIKNTRNPEQMNLTRLQELYGQTLPEMEPIPQFLIDHWDCSPIGNRLKRNQ